MTSLMILIMINRPCVKGGYVAPLTRGVIATANANSLIDNTATAPLPHHVTRPSTGSTTGILRRLLQWRLAPNPRSRPRNRSTGKISL
jgi:hypothetical protein